MVTQVTKTLDDLVLEVRAILNDSQIPYRYSDNLIVQHTNTILREVYRLRPDLYIGNFTLGVLSANLVNTYSIADLQVANGVPNPTPPLPITPFPIDDRLAFGPCVFYVAGRTEINDDEFADNNRAMTLMQAFRAELIGMGG
jgi:hypothetical protein